MPCVKMPHLVRALALPLPARSRRGRVGLAGCIGGGDAHVAAAAAGGRRAAAALMHPGCHLVARMYLRTQGNAATGPGNA